MKIVLALDGSDFSKAAVEQLNRITLPPSTEICIINVYEFPTAIGPELMATGGSLNNYYEEFKAVLKNWVKKLFPKPVTTLRI